MKKSVLSILLILCMVVVILPIMAETSTNPQCATVTSGGTTSEAMTLGAAFEYAKGVSNPVIELIGENQTYSLSEYIECIDMSSVAFTFDGKGNTITGLRFPLFKLIKNATIKNLNISNSSVVINPYSDSTKLGIIACDVGAGVVTVSGINISNSTVTGNGHAAALIGYTSGNTITISDCTLTDVSVTGDDTAGAAVAYGSFPEGSKTENLILNEVTVTSTNDSDPQNIGLIIGRINGGALSISANVNKNCSVAPASEMSNRICGHLNGGNLKITGGSYPADPTKVLTVNSNCSASVDGTMEKVGDEYVVKAPVTTPEVQFLKSASYKDHINLLFYLDLTDDTALDKIKIEVTYADGRTLELDANTRVNIKGSEKTYSKIICPLNAKELADKLTVKVFFDDKEIGSLEYSFQDYAKTVLKSENEKITESEKEVVKACLNYGSAAQTWQNYNTENLANSILTSN